MYILWSCDVSALSCDIYSISSDVYSIMQLLHLPYRIYITRLSNMLYIGKSCNVYSTRLSNMNQNSKEITSQDIQHTKQDIAHTSKDYRM